MSDSQNRSGDEKPSTAATTLAEKTVTDEDDFLTYEPSVTVSVFVTWILPALLIAIFTRFAVDKDAMTSTTTLRPPPPRPVQINLNSDSSSTSPSSLPSSSDQATKKKKKKKAPAPVPTLIADKPSIYIETVQAIGRRRLDWGATDTGPVGPPSTSTTTKENVKPPSDTSKTTPPPTDSTTTTNNGINTKPAMKEPARGASSDPVRVKFREKIDQLRGESQVSQTCLSLFLSVQGEESKRKSYKLLPDCSHQVLPPLYGPIIAAPFVSSFRQIQKTCLR